MSISFVKLTIFLSIDPQLDGAHKIYQIKKHNDKDRVCRKYHSQLKLLFAENERK